MTGLLELRSVTRRFGDLVALDGIDLTLRPGEVHAVVGENGAGKSTLVNVVSGFLRPNLGRVSLDGSDIPVGDPKRVRQKGVAVVHQHFMLTPEMTVAENLALAAGKSIFSRSQPLEDARPALTLAEQLGWDLPANTPTSQLPVGLRQRVEIVKALAQPFQVLLLDEPTAVLSPAEVLDLFRVLQQLKAEGKTVVLVAHKIAEVLSVADRVSVLRRGRIVVADVPTEVLSPDQLAEWIVGEPPSPPTPREGDPHGRVILRASKLVVHGDRGEEAVRGLDFSLREGEILGVGGVDGNGQSELAEAIAGIRPIAAGELSRDYDTAKRVAYIPQDRQVDGLALMMSIRENLLIGNVGQRNLRTGAFLRRRSIIAWAQDLVRQFGVKCRTIDDPTASLSGGNKQKVVVARNLASSRPLVVAVNPTRGLDVKAAENVLSVLIAAARGGAGVLLISADLDELAQTADRISILSRGQLLDFKDAASVLGGVGTP